MNSKKIAEAFGGINDRYLNEALEYKRGSQRGGITMSKKKIVSIVIAAALVISVMCLSVFATAGGLDALRGFFSGRVLDTEKNDSAGNLPVIDDIGSIMTEIDSSESDDSDITGQRVRLVSAVCDKYSFYGTVEFNALGISIPEGVADDKIILGYVSTNQSFGMHPDVRFVSRDGDIFTFIFSITEEGELPPKAFTFSIGSIGYREQNWQYFPIAELNERLVVNRSELNVLDSIESKNIAVVDGIIEMKAELFPLGLKLYYDDEQAKQWGEESEIAKEHGWDWYKYSMGTVYSFLTIEMKDGTVYEQYYDLVCGLDTFRDLDTGKNAGTRLTFSVPLDISQIAKITYCGAEFEF